MKRLLPAIAILACLSLTACGSSNKTVSLDQHRAADQAEMFFSALSSRDAQRVCYLSTPQMWAAQRWSADGSLRTCEAGFKIWAKQSGGLDPFDRRQLSGLGRELATGQVVPQPQGKDGMDIRFKDAAGKQCQDSRMRMQLEGRWKVSSFIQGRCMGLLGSKKSV